MGVLSFFKLSNAKDEKLHKILCLACWGIGGIIYTINYLDTLGWTFTYPNPNFLAGAAWVMNLALRIFCMWIPMSFLLLQWKTKFLSLILYMVGGLVALLLSLLSVALVLPYLINSKLMDQNYFELIRPSFAVGKYPFTMKAAYAFDDCCAWHGPADFCDEEISALINRQKDKNEDFMREIAICSGRIFTVEKAKSGNLIYSPGAPGSSSNGELPKGCKEVQITRANRIGVMIFAMTLVMWCIIPLLMFKHFQMYKRLGIGGKTPVRPATSQQMHQAQSYSSETKADDPETKQTEAPNSGAS